MVAIDAITSDGAALLALLEALGLQSGSFYGHVAGGSYGLPRLLHQRSDRLKHAVIMDVEAAIAVRQEKAIARRRMLDRTRPEADACDP